MRKIILDRIKEICMVTIPSIIALVFCQILDSKVLGNGFVYGISILSALIATFIFHVLLMATGLFQRLRGDKAYKIEGYWMESFNRKFGSKYIEGRSIFRIRYKNSNYLYQGCAYKKQNDKWIQYANVDGEFSDIKSTTPEENEFKLSFSYEATVYDDGILENSKKTTGLTVIIFSNKGKNIVEGKGKFLSLYTHNNKFNEKEGIEFNIRRIPKRFMRYAQKNDAKLFDELKS